jgi:hypothetical protein
MSDYKIRFRRIFWIIIISGVALVTLSGCAKATEVAQPLQVPVEVAGVEIHASPVDLALTRTDLSAGFQLAGEKSAGPEYAALYLRPSALDSQASGGNMLLSVLTSVGVYTTTAEAKQVYLEASADPTKQLDQDITLISEDATDFVIEPIESEIQGADESEVVRVTYRIMDQNIFEYGHRFRLGNVLVYIVVSAIGNPDEPQTLLEDARAIIQRQIDRIAAAASQSEPK